MTEVNSISDHDGVRTPIDRRRFIVGSSSTVAALMVLPRLELSATMPAAVRAMLPRPPKPSLTTTLRRREDFVNLEYRFFNLILRADGAQSNLVRLDPAQEAWVVVTFAPQNIVEQAFAEVGGVLPLPGAVEGRLAMPTRLAFTVPPDVTSIPYDKTGLLEWASWAQRVAPAAQPTPGVGSPPLRQPSPTETAIEMPWWLQLSPSAAAGLWDSRLNPKTANDRTELWHARLVMPEPRQFSSPAFRAIWARDFESGTGAPASMSLPCGFPGTGHPFQLQSLTPRDRGDIVISSALAAPSRPAPRPLQLNELLLTSLGGWLDVQGEWNTVDTGLSLESWTHRATGGRDQFVRVVRTGFLFPLGHRAVEIKITERKPGVPSGNAQLASAYLRQRTFIVVRQPVRRYGGTGGADKFSGRGWPFASVRLLTKVTPNITKQELAPPNQVNIAKVYVPYVDGAAFQFEAIGIDREGREVPFTTPLVWVDGSSAQAPACAAAPGGAGTNNALGAIYDGTTLANVITAFMAGNGGSRPEIALPGSPLSLAPTIAGANGSTSYDARKMRLSVGPAAIPTLGEMNALFAKSEPPFHPLLDWAEVALGPAAVANGGATKWATASYLASYVLSDFGTGEVFAALASPVNLQFASGGRGGGVATPNLALTGLSRKLGVFAGKPGDVNNGIVTPADLFLADARLLGGLLLKDVVKPDGLATMPVLRSTVSGPPTAPTATDTTMTWTPQLQADPKGILGVAGSSFVVTGKYHQDLMKPALSTSVVTGDLRNVSLTLVPGAKFIKVSFDRIAFRSENGAKTETKVDIGSVEFLGALKYLAKLAALVKTVDTGQNGPYLDVTPTLVTTGLAFTLPAVQVGAFALENVAMRSELRLPLTGAPVTTRFAFSTREDPFHLTVLALGGGGFAAIEIGADGPKALDIALEAGAMVALNVGVAKGKLEAFAGIYYRLENDVKTGSQVSVYDAYVRMGGSLRLLGVVSVSSKIYVELEYSEAGNKLHGSASLSYSIDLGLFEKTVSFTVKRQFAGDSSDPFLSDRYTPDDWTDYCNAFAEVAS